MVSNKLYFRNLLLSIFLVIIFSLIYYSCEKTNIKEENIDPDEIVYICTGRLSKAYHITEDCRGLKNCSKDIEEVTKSEAENMSRHLCGFCRNR